MFEKHHVGIFIKELMDFKNISDVEVSRLTGISRDHLIKIKKTESNLGIDIATKLAPILGVSTTLLLNIQTQYLKYKNVKNFIEKHKITGVNNYIINLAYNSSLNEKSYSSFRKDKNKYIRDFNIVHYEPKKSKDAKNFLLIQSLLGIKTCSNNFNLLLLQEYLFNDFRKNVGLVTEESDISSFYRKLIQDLKKYGVHLNIIFTNLKTTIKGISKIDIGGDSVKIIVENTGNFANDIFHITHELSHIIIYFNNKKDLEIEEDTEKQANLLSIKILANQFGEHLMDLNESDFANFEKIDGINQYVIYSIWKYFKKDHNKKNYIYQLIAKEQNDFYS